MLCSALMAASMMAGCSTKDSPSAQAPPEEALMNEQIETVEKWAEQLENVTNKSTYEKALAAEAELKAKVAKLTEDFNALPQERKDAARSVLGAKLQEATLRLSAAKVNAYRASANPG
jgi:hypothetical protein